MHTYKHAYIHTREGLLYASLGKDLYTSIHVYIHNDKHTRLHTHAGVLYAVFGKEVVGFLDVELYHVHLLETVCVCVCVRVCV